MPSWLKKSLIIFVSLIAVGSAVGAYFYQHDSKFRYWWNLPLENRWLSVRLETERPLNHLLTDDVDPATYESVNTKTLTVAIQSGADWILRMQEPSGRFNYWYNPENDTFSSRSEDNFLRQAGTNYSLLAAYEVTGDSTVLNGALKNLEFLNQHLITPHPDTAYYMFRRKAKLGGIALPMLVMLKLREINKDTLFDSRLKALGNMILHLQSLYNSGQYKSTYVYYGDYEYEKSKGWESNIYPGEAMLALIEMYAAFGDERYLESLRWAHQYYSNDGNWRHFSFMPWAAIAMSKAAILTGEEDFLTFAYQMTDRILYWQNLDRHKKYYGSLFGVPTVFTATWMEGVGAALALARHRKEKEKEAHYQSRLMIALKWLMQLQYTQEELDRKALPVTAKGGFRRSLIEPEIRIDNTQHALSAMIKAVNHLTTK